MEARMPIYRTLIVMLALFLVPSMAVARGGGGGGRGGGHSGGSHSGGHSGGHDGGHHSGIPHSGSPSDVHSHSDSAPRAIGPKAHAPSPSHESKPKTETKPKSQVTSAKPPATKSERCSRDALGKIQRSEVAKR